MSDDFTRREFLGTAGAAAAALMLSDRSTPPSPGIRAGDVILFQGDSITDGGRNRTVATPNSASALGSGYPLLVASAMLNELPERALQFFNRGVSGDKVPDLVARWETDTIALAPTVLSVLVGVNDFWHRKLRGYTGTVADFETGLVALLEGTRRALPSVRLIVLEPFVLRCGVVDDTWFPEFDERRAAAARAAARVRATFVPLQDALTERATRTTPQYWAADGVHPTPAGHALIAARWRDAARV